MSKDVQFSPFSIRHGKKKVGKKMKLPLDSKRPSHTTSAHKGVGYYGAQSPGGRGKP